MSFKNELKALRKFAFENEYKVCKDKLKTDIQDYLKRRVQDINNISSNNISSNKISCNIYIDRGLVNVSTDTVLDIIKQIFKELDIENDVSDIDFKYESSYQDSYYRLKFKYMVE